MEWPDIGFGSMQRKRSAAEGRAGEYLARIAQKYLPGQDANVVAEILLQESDHPSRQAVVELLDEAIVKAAQGHAPGISPDEREALGGSSWLPDYLLGPGDQKVYESLRDSNMLNAALGRQHVATARDLVGTPDSPGRNYAASEDGSPLPGRGGDPFNPPAHLADGQERTRALEEAMSYHDWGSEDPTRHSSMWTSFYPQHATATSLQNAVSNNGDTAVGQTLSELTAWSDASRRATRKAEPDLIAAPDAVGYGIAPGLANAGKYVVNNVYKFAKNFGSELPKAKDHEWGSAAVGRASPLVPNVSGPTRQDFIDNVQHAVANSRPPTVQEYGAATGKSYSPIFSWFQDSMHELVDPITPVSAATGGALAVTKGGLKAGGRGALKSLVTEVPKIAGREGAQEGASPLNWALLSAKFPITSTLFSAEELSPTEKALAGPTLKAKERTAERNLENLGQMRRDAVGRE
jgi:hypothetical protein